MDQYCPGIEGLFISTGWRKKRVSCNTISFWLRSVISMAHASASEEVCRSLRVRAHEIRKTAMSMLFQEVLCGPSGTEGGNVVRSVDLLSGGCHSQALGHLLPWSCGGGSEGHVTR